MSHIVDETCGSKYKGWGMKEMVCLMGYEPMIRFRHIKGGHLSQDSLHHIDAKKCAL